MIPPSLLLLESDPAARERIARMCALKRLARLHAEVSLGSEACPAADALRPDVILVASHLPDMSGLEAIRTLRDPYRRRAILLTADLEERAGALAAGALDFLLQPVEADALEISLLRARGRFGVRKLFPRTAGSTDAVAPGWERKPERPFVLVAEREHRLYPVQPSHISYVEAAGNYVKYYVDKCEYIARESISRLEVVLARLGFIRIERSLLVNVRAIYFVETSGQRTFSFTLNSGTCLHSGPAYRKSILQALPLRRRARNGATGGPHPDRAP